MSSAIDKVQAFLDDMQSGLKVMVIDADTSTSELAARALGLEPGQIAKSLLFKSKSSFFMIVAAGDVRLDLKMVKELVGSRIRLADPDETMEQTGYPVGGVCPFCLPHPLPIYLDESMLRFDVVYAAAGTANSALPVTFEQLQAITGGIPCSVSLR
ncbi:MAG: YbaK/EbsC family protein [Acidobacteriota bacterium]